MLGELPLYLYFAINPYGYRGNCITPTIISSKRVGRRYFKQILNKYLNLDLG